MDRKEIAEKLKIHSMLVEQWVELIRGYVNNFAKNYDNVTEFSEVEANAFYTFYSEMKRTNNKRYAIRSLIAYLERDKVMKELRDLIIID